MKTTICWNGSYRVSVRVQVTRDSHKNGAIAFVLLIFLAYLMRNHTTTIDVYNYGYLQKTAIKVFYLILWFNVALMKMQRVE